MDFNLTVVMKVDEGLSTSPWTAHKMNLSIMPKLSYNVHCTVTVSELFAASSLLFTET